METGKGLKVIYVPDDVSEVAPREMPPWPSYGTLVTTISDPDYVSPGYGEMCDGDVDKQGNTLHRWPFDLVVCDSYPMSHPKGDEPVDIGNDFFSKAVALSKKRIVAYANGKNQNFAMFRGRDQSELIACSAVPAQRYQDMTIFAGI